MIPSPLLVVTDRHGASRPLTETVRAVLDGGARWLWFRDRDMEAGARRELATDVLALVRAAGGRLMIGGDAELAAAIGADGVHLSGSAFGDTDPIRFPDDEGFARIPSPRTRGEGFGDLVVAEARRQPTVRGRDRTSLARSRPLTLAPASPALAADPTRGPQPSPRVRGEGGAASPNEPSEHEQRSSHTSPHPEVPASAGLEGALQEAERELEGSFEGAATRRHLRMRGRVGEAVAGARLRLGPPALIGLSAHRLSDVRAAAQAGADYVTLSPIFSTPSKPGYGPALGLAALRAAAEIGIPVVALGGIGVGEARACRDAGAAGVAVMGALMRAKDPAAQARVLLDALR